MADQGLTSRQQARLEREWEEVKEYRDLLQPPDRFDEGFTMRTIIGVLFISLIMTPGEMYLGLVTGGGIGAAAQWVTVILFLEVAKRSFTSLTRQEIYLLVYVAGALVVREEGAFLDLLWRQYFVRSPEAEQFGVSEVLPFWWAPGPESEAHGLRTFLHPDWAWPIGLLVLGTIVGRVSWFTSGYVLFRLTSDREQLPFPTAPMSALGSMALAEESGHERETWKWPIFSVGAVIGVAFGILYVGIPTLTEVLGRRQELIPIPFADLTPYFGNFLPGAPLGVTLHLGPIFAGLLMPFWSVIGSFAGVVVHTAVSPVLHHLGLLPRWVLGMDTISTQIATGIDFWRAFGIGITLAVTLISFYQLWATLGRRKDQIQQYFGDGGTAYPATCRHDGCNQPSEVRGYCLRHLGRGDFHIWACIALFSLSAIYPIVLAKTLFPTLVGVGLLVTFCLIAFVYAPIMSFVSARLDGLIGREVSIPYINEAIIFLTGYRGVDVWFVPFPTRNFGGHAEGFRVVELVGMRFTSLLKAELFMLPIVFGVSLMYWTFLWRLAPIPSESYPYAQRMWPLRAFDQALFLSSTMYSKTWRAGERLEDDLLEHGEVAWSPSNLQDGHWWYWRVRATREHHIPDELKREYGPWSETRCFYTDFRGGNPPRAGPDLQAFEQSRPQAAATDTADGRGRAPGALEPPPAPGLVWPPHGAVLQGGEAMNPNLRAQLPLAPADSVEFHLEIDLRPSFDGTFLQRSSDVPMMYEVLWEDVKYTGDGRDDDGDGLIDEEVRNGSDDDGDGLVDEDIHHPLGGKKWKIILIGAGFGLTAYFTLAAFGVPIFLIWGYVQSVNGIPHALLPQIIGALLGRYYFWKRYGKQQWRRYAMVLSVGFGVGMALVGMFCAALAMISKGVSTLTH